MLYSVTWVTVAIYASFPCLIVKRVVKNKKTSNRNLKLKSRSFLKLPNSCVGFLFIKKTIPAAQIEVWMTTRNRLNDELRWRAIGRLEVVQSQAEVVRWLQVSSMVVSRLWQQFQTTGTITRRTGQGLPRITTPSEDRYVALNARRHRDLTAGQLSQDLSAASGTRISSKSCIDG